mmetsp:Transcript_16044/g.23229  ORF Transcript_16044/g.23229 Transcript_16044/m.23229 type:complete len:253 (+) Transcript_16044:98-856(+)
MRVGHFETLTASASLEMKRPTIGEARLAATAPKSTFARLVAVEERKAGDESIHAVEARLHEVLGVVAEELEDSKHGKTAVLKLLGLALLELLSVKVRLAGVEVAEVSPVVDGADEEEDLHPSESRDGVDGSHSVGHLGAREAGGDVEWEAVDLRHDVAEDGELGHASVLELGGAVLVEGLLVNVSGEAKRIEEAGRGQDADFVRVVRLHDGLRGHACLWGHEGGGGGEAESENESTEHGGERWWGGRRQQGC